MSDLIEKPELLFFRKTPADLLARPPLASSLQSFESCLILIGLGRFPHAFTASVFAIESTLKAHFRLPWELSREDNNRFGKLEKLLREALNEFPSLQSLPQDKLKEMRGTRNRIAHYGFSPKDDQVTAKLLLEIAIPLLATLYEAAFAFDLYDGLVLEFAEQLRHAVAAYGVFKNQPALNPVRCFDVLGHLAPILSQGFVRFWLGGRGC